VSLRPSCAIAIAHATRKSSITRGSRVRPRTTRVENPARRRARARPFMHECYEPVPARTTVMSLPALEPVGQGHSGFTPSVWIANDELTGPVSRGSNETENE
jgi:hypothetical protein